MKLDLTPRQAAWLRDALRRVDEGQNLDDEEQAALDTYYNAEYYEWLQDREIDGRPLTPEQENYLQAFVGYDGQPDGARVYHEPAARRVASRRRKRGGCFGNLVGLVLVALAARWCWNAAWTAAPATASPAVARSAAAPAPKPAKSVAEVVAAKAAKARAAEQPAVPARSEWRTITYIGGDDREHPALVGDDRSGGCLVIRDPRGACLFEIQAPKSLPMGGATEWTGPIQIGKRVLSMEQWTRRTDRIGMMKLVDARGDFEPGHGRDLLARLVAEDESGNIIVGYLRPGGGKWALSIPLRGLRAAVDALPPL